MSKCQQRDNQAAHATQRSGTHTRLMPLSQAHAALVICHASSIAHTGTYIRPVSAERVWGRVPDMEFTSTFSHLLKCTAHPSVTSHPSQWLRRAASLPCQCNLKLLCTVHGTARRCFESWALRRAHCRCLLELAQS